MNSMTGFGRAKLEKESREYLIEIRSVNHKYSDITVKAPHSLLYLEDKIRKAVLNRVARGKIDVYVSYENYGIEGKNLVINKDLAKRYIQELSELAEENDIPSGIRASEISKLPDVMSLQMQEDSLETIWIEIAECLENG